ncbi:MAG: nitrile hydratase subunit beta [Gammaproteobacteria bacterium]|jgi:nitrile hydratase|nr:nitrile hydratase subunit beta [Gammaproteobacteria bacterium]
MNRFHDLGGQHGYGSIEWEPDEPVFHERWEGRVFGMSLATSSSEGINLDATRHRAEQLDPVSYFQNGYFGRWLASLELKLEEEGLLADGELDQRLQGKIKSSAKESKPPPAPEGNPLRGLHVIREVDEPPAFAQGQAIRTRNHQPAGHTRLPAYARCRSGIIARVHPAMVFPDTNAHGKGENPQYVYTVEFAGEELWGDSAEPGTFVRLDLWESYLAAA